MAEPTDEELVAGLTPAEIFAGPGTTQLRRQWRLAHGRDPDTGQPRPVDDLAGDSIAPDQPAEADPVSEPPRPRRWAAWRERRRGRAVTRRAATPSLPTTAPSPPADRSRWAILGVAVLGALVLVIVGVGLNTALGALQDMARSAHIDDAAADLYWIGVDGLIVVAIIAAMILRHDRNARRYALGIVVAFTALSGVLQYLHGLGWTTPNQVTGVVPKLPWPVVAVVALLVIGTIFCGTHLFVYVLRHLFPRALADQRLSPEDPVASEASAAPETATSDSDTGDGSDGESRPEKAEQPLMDAETEREIRKWFAAITVHLILDAGGKPTRSKIAGSFGIADRQAGYVIADVIADREEAAERERQEAALRERVTQMREDALMTDESVLRVNGSAAPGGPAHGSGA
ncbi:hypothetical protein [Nonomuraea dietziae]|uniref:hypothetical protein n=1 Tax=Nonomuraea dietziae TaxID=65515 RepID=UPI00341545CA